MKAERLRTLVYTGTLTVKAERGLCLYRDTDSEGGVRTLVCTGTLTVKAERGLYLYRDTDSEGGERPLSADTTGKY